MPKLEARVNFYVSSVAIYGARDVGCTVGSSLDGSGHRTRYGTLDPVHHTPLKRFPTDDVMVVNFPKLGT